MNVLLHTSEPRLPARRHTHRRPVGTKEDTRTEGRTTSLYSYAVYCILMCTLPLSIGCGVQVRGQIWLQTLTGQTSIYSGQATQLRLTTKLVPPQAQISLKLTCDASNCGTLKGDEYQSPANQTSSIVVNITATTSNVTAPAHLQLTVLPVPTIAGISPGWIPAGGAIPITISGSAFNKNLTVSATSLQKGIAPVISKTALKSDTSLTFTIHTTPGITGTVNVELLDPSSPKFHTSSLALQVVATSTPNVAGLPIINVSSYGASGSPASYSCSGDAGSDVLTCNSSNLDFAVGEGIRIVGGGNPVHVSAMLEQPTVQRQGTDTTDGVHTYCYVVFRADAFGGITQGSPPSCIGGEPTLSFHYYGAYNALGDTQTYPLAANLWYRSVDDGPYRLFSVNSASQVLDVGQKTGSYGGWPASLPGGDGDISKPEDLFTTVAAVSGNTMKLAGPLIANVDDTTVDHDDTMAIQAALSAASSRGGAIVSLGSGTYNIRRPSFGKYPGDSTWYTGSTRSYSNAQSWSGWGYLSSGEGVPGNIIITGQGDSTIINTVPDSGGLSALLSVNSMTRPAYVPGAMTIDPVSAGSTKVVLRSPLPPKGIRPGTDIWLYSGCYNSRPCKCVNKDGTAGGQCHYSELNTVASIDGNVLTLRYPTSKRYFDDGSDSFGLVAMPTVTHNVALEKMTINTYNRVISVGIVYGLLIDHITVNGMVNLGPFGGGFKRDELIENSSWSLGEGDPTGSGSEEFDQYTDLELLNDKISGNFPRGAEGPSLMSKLYMTEGTSNVTVTKCSFNNVSLYFQETNGDVISNNTFINGVVQVGNVYAPSTYQLLMSPQRLFSVLSFDSQNTARIFNNKFTIQAGYGFPWVIDLGNYAYGSIEDNIIKYDGSGNLAIIRSSGGDIVGNHVIVGSGKWNPIGIAAIPDEGPNLPTRAFRIENNVIKGSSMNAGIDIPDVGYVDESPICIQNNTVSGADQSLDVGQKNDVVLSCTPGQ